MITGDYKLTASAIAKELGLKVADKNIITGKELDGMSDEDFTKIIKNINVYARVTPQHKLRIVSAWRSLGEVVAMTGDGVNDAPALKSADIGIAVGSGTDVTKATADMILLDNNFSDIIEAIKEGRKIFLNIKKVIVYLLADSFSEVILVFGSLLLGLPLPITAAQILWINLITDGFPAAALTVEKSHDDVMQQKPRAKNEKIFDKEMKALIFIIGIFVDLILLSLFYYLYNKTTLDLNYIRTILFAALGIDSLFYVFSCKSLRHSIFKINIFDNKFLNLAVISGIMLQLVVLYVPALRDVFGLTFLGALDWSLVVSLAVLKVVLIEVTKYIYMGNKINGKTIWNY